MTLSPARRWTLYGLLCVAGIFNAMDRPVIAILKPDMSADLGWSDAQFGELAAVTQFAAALSFLFTGWLIDRLAVRRSVVVGVAAWSLAALAHGWARTGAQVVGARLGLGATEAVQTPLSIKTVAILFPPARRSVAIGLGTAVAGVGTILMPFGVPLLAAAFGWRGALIFAGIGGFATLAAWLVAARGVRFDPADDPAPGDLDAARPEDVRPYGPILSDRRTWAIVVAKALSDSTWWLLNFWLADFYRRRYGLSTVELAVPLAIAFAGSAGGAVLAGWASTRAIERGHAPARVRRAAMLASALVVLPLPLVLELDSFWPVAVMMGLVLAGHQGFSLSLFSVITDVVPRAKVGRVTAFGAFCGNIGGMAVVWAIGRWLTAGGGFTPFFAFAAVSYLLAYGWFRLVMPDGHAMPRLDAA